MTSIQRINNDHTEAIWQDIHTKLQNARERARKGKLAAFEETNRQRFDEAQAHLDALTWKDGDELNTALSAAGAWLAGL